MINGEKGIVMQSFAKDLHQTGDIRLAELSGGTAHNIVPAQASALLACSRQTAEKIAARHGDKISCTLTPEGVRIDAEGIDAHGASPEKGENAIGRLMPGSPASGGGGEGGGQSAGRPAGYGV